LTFDDGWASDITNVVPVLQSHGLRATFFIVARYGGWHSPAYLTWDQIKAIRNAGMWIGSHSFSHTNLNKLNAAGLRYEVADSKVEIEKHISGSVTVFDYPYGAYSPRVVKAVQYAGYVAAVVISPMIRQRSDQIYRLNRITMSNAVTMERFKFYMSGGKIAPLLSPRRSSLWNPGRACHHHPC
jgi:peptidoglycan/xylan/chitin deacetylase (PgdA/CDA1 family)